MVESASAFLMRAKSVRGKAGEGIPNVSPSDLLRVIRGRSNGSGLWRGDGEEAGLGRLESIGVGPAASVLFGIIWAEWRKKRGMFP